MSGKYNTDKYIIGCVAACALWAAGWSVAVAAVPGSFDEASRMSADLKPEQVKTGQIATATPLVEMRAVETRVLINGEWRTIVHYVPYKPDSAGIKGMSAPNSPMSMTSQSKSVNDRNVATKEPEPVLKPAVKRKRKTALHKIVQETPSTTEVDRIKK
ncbi:MAG TPA: hypothetical protein PLU72_05410 [Candidatus Ozemobacteraceae bacterium]|nr:hypothetical protein [Candidatus Ozemobacteraceae bacterium]HQG27669.1 hypothetical protein [Candidatus Ozemobacteraceae bacterium]